MVLFRIKMPCSYRRSPHILLTRQLLQMKANHTEEWKQQGLSRWGGAGNTEEKRTQRIREMCLWRITLLVTLPAGGVGGERLCLHVFPAHSFLPGPWTVGTVSPLQNLSYLG